MTVLSVDLALARRIELAEAQAAVDGAETFERLRPDSGAAVERVAGGFAVYCGANSPITQAVGLGLGGAVSEEEFDRTFAVNVKGVFLGCQAVVPVFRKAGGGVIINIGSTAAIRPRPGTSAYAGTKGAVHTITKGLAGELAEDKIRVCAIAPVATETPPTEIEIVSPVARGVVLVATASAHRGDAFAAAEFLMDYLKTRAPFWKREERGGARECTSTFYGREAGKKHLQEE